MQPQLSRSAQIIAIACFGVGLFAAWQWLNSSEAEPPAAVTLPTSTEVAEVQVGEVVVDVVGAVRSPGVVRLPAGSRVLDAVTAAGGVRSGATPGVNLARVLVDGEQIVVGQAQRANDGKVDLNRATAGEFEALPGIGPVLAGRIVDYRERNGPFRKVSDLDAVSGVGAALLAQLTDLVAVG